MLDFITVPLVVRVITLSIYRVLDSLIRRKERLKLIEKIEDVPTEFLKNGVSLPLFNEQRPLAKHNRFSPLLICGLLIGIGLGLLVVVIIQKYNYVSFQDDYYYLSALYGSCVLLFGGLGLLSAFFLERALKKKDNK